MKYPFQHITPLSIRPYYSRVGNNEFKTATDSKNYVLIAFGAGDPLQASELNEIQETYYKNLTLYNILLKNWIFIGDPGFTSGDATLPVRGPSWVGAVPLDPLSSVTCTGNTITFKQDWYLVDDKSGIKFWIYNNEDISITVTDADAYIGFDITMEYNTTDPGLADNSNGYLSSNSTVTDRYQINITGASSSPLEITAIRNVLHKTTTDGVVRYRYLNNLQKVEE